MKLFVKTRNGKGLHGEIIGDSFVRKVDARHIRWSDRSFCINSTIVDKIKGGAVQFVEFRWKRAYTLEVYRLPVEEFLQLAREITNEHGEKNYRIEISSCNLIKTIQTEKQPEELPPVEVHEKQQQLF